MSEIEFLDPGPAAPPPQVEAPSARPGWRSRLPRMVVPGVWAIAAVLAFLAPFHMLYRLQVRAYTVGDTEQVDGWGRLITNDDLPYTQHDPRYGALSCVVAGLFLLAALSTVVPLLERRDGPRRGLRHRLPFPAFGAAVGLWGIGMLVATVTSALLGLQAVTNNINAQLAAPTDDQVLSNGPPGAGTVFDLGAMVWLSVAAAVAALVALTVAALQRWVRSRVEPPADAMSDRESSGPVPDGAGHRGDELLT